MDVTIDGNVTVRGNVDIEGLGNGVTTDHDAMYFYPKDIESGTAALVPSTGSSNVGAYWAFDSTTLERIKFFWTPPLEWEAFVGRLGFIAPTNGGGSVTWRWRQFQLPLGGNPATAPTIIGTETMAGPTGLGAGWTYDDAAGSAASPLAIIGGTLTMTEIERVPDGSAGTDDMNGDAGIFVVTATRY